MAVAVNGGFLLLPQGRKNSNRDETSSNSNLMTSSPFYVLF